MLVKAAHLILICVPLGDAARRTVGEPPAPRLEGRMAIKIWSSILQGGSVARPS
jgi:hypothetical protein